MSTFNFSPEELQALRDLVNLLERRAAEQERQEAAEKTHEEFAKRFTLEEMTTTVAGFPEASRERIYQDYPQLRPKP